MQAHGASSCVYAAPNVLEGTYGATSPGFGAWGTVRAGSSPFAKRQRPTNLGGGSAAGLFVPWLTFALVYSLQSFSLHYDNPSLCAIINLTILGMVLCFGLIAATAWRRRDDAMQDPKWCTFVFATSLLAWLLAFGFGYLNFALNIAPYLDTVYMNVYPSVDPARYRGQQLMDAGRIGFTPESHLDLQLSMGFVNWNTYCVAPITSPSQQRNASDDFPNYDFWAVGMNCCSGHKPDFHCGEYNNDKARSGLKLMREDHVPYYRLAVQQAEAAYMIRAQHPVFFEWMEDPNTEVRAYLADGYWYWMAGLGGYLAYQMLLVAVAAVILPKLAL